MSGRQKGYSIRWVDGTHYDQSLAGKMVPHSGQFPRKAKIFDMDAPGTNGIVNDPKVCALVCGFCGTTGHQASECPPMEEQRDGKTYVNWRWLFKKGLCKGDGSPK